MKCNLTRENLMDYLYEEMGEQERVELEAHLQSCPACKNQVSEFREAVELLNLGTEETPAEKLTFVPNRGPSLRRFSWRGSTAGHIGLAFALGALCATFVLSLSKFEFSYSDGEFSGRFGAETHKEGPLAAMQPENELATRSELRSYREDAVHEVEELLRTSEERQKNEIRAVLRAFAEELQRQRRQDLEWVGQGLESYHLTNRADLQRTNQVLDRLIRVAGEQANQLQAIQISGGKKE